MVSWREEYRKRLVSPEEAVRIVRSGDKVVFTNGSLPLDTAEALLRRRKELANVQLWVPTPGDFHWYEDGWEQAFDIKVSYSHPRFASKLGDVRKVDSVSGMFGIRIKPELDGRPDAHPPDVLITEVSPPDQHGFCSFGRSLWQKKDLARIARTVIAEVNPSLIRTYGDNFIHVSELHFLVEQKERPRSEKKRGGEPPPPAPHIKPIAEYVATLIRDGDTLQVGTGTTSEPLILAGILDGKHDIGWHSEVTPRGTINLVKEGVINGKRKTVHTGKVVGTALGVDREDVVYIDENPLFELYSVYHVNNVLTVAAHDNMVAINNGLAVDLTGQIAAESLGPRMMSGSGGLTDFAIGAVHSKGGRSILVLPSTASNGTVSRIVSVLEPGTVVTVPRSCADYIVTEYGIASLLAKTQRQRAEQLIAVAHPDFRSELQKEARKLYWG